MKKNLVFVFIISLFGTTGLFSQLNAFDNSICWEIKSSETSKPSYILGSVHVLDTTKIDFPIQGVKHLIDVCGSFCSEINHLSQDSSQMTNLIKAAILTDKKLNLKDSLGVEYYDKLMQIVDSSKGSLKVLKPLLSIINPVFIGLFVTMEKQTSNANLYDQANFLMDSYFEQYATSKGFGIRELESTQKQIDMITGGTYGESILALKTCIDGFFSNDSIDMLENYLNQNLRILQENDYLESTMIDRNRVMADGIDRLLRENTVFVVIGAAHLPYKYGVLNILSQRGYIVKPYKLQMIKRMK